MGEEKTIGTLQACLPWGAHDYSAEFQADESTARDFKHALLHVTKATGKVAAVVDDFDHEGALHLVHKTMTRKALADIVICVLRMANTYPDGPINLAQAVEDRLAEKFPVKP